MTVSTAILTMQNNLQKNYSQLELKQTMDACNQPSAR